MLEIDQTKFSNIEGVKQIIGSILHHPLILEHAYKLSFMSNLCKNNIDSRKMALWCLICGWNCQNKLFKDRKGKTWWK